MELIWQRKVIISEVSESKKECDTVYYEEVEDMVKVNEDQYKTWIEE